MLVSLVCMHVLSLPFARAGVLGFISGVVFEASHGCVRSTANTGTHVASMCPGRLGGLCCGVYIGIGIGICIGIGMGMGIGIDARPVQVTDRQALCPRPRNKMGPSGGDPLWSHIL